MGIGEEGRAVAVEEGDADLGEVKEGDQVLPHLLRALHFFLTLTKELSQLLAEGADVVVGKEGALRVLSTTEGAGEPSQPTDGAVGRSEAEVSADQHAEEDQE